jgi:hypothetical protein
MKLKLFFYRFKIKICNLSLAKARNVCVAGRQGLLTVSSFDYFVAKNNTQLKTRIFTIVGLMFLLLSTSSFALTDSTKTKKSQPSAHWRLIARLHSQGIFTYGGRLGSENPTFDVNFTYDRKKWGFLVFKGLDLQDHNTFYNFGFIAVYKNFKLSKKVTFTPQVSSFLEESNSIADKGSDLAAILITSIKLNPQWTVEHMSLATNLLIDPEERDWVNRLRLTYTGKHLDVVSSVWWNNQVFDHSYFYSTALNVAYSRVKVREHFFLSFGVTGLLMLHTSNAETNPNKNGLMVTLAAQVIH